MYVISMYGQWSRSNIMTPGRIKWTFSFWPIPLGGTRNQSYCETTGSAGFCQLCSRLWNTHCNISYQTLQSAGGTTCV
jgi:hypothetical protein